MDCNLPGSSVHGISQAQVLEWVAISFSIMSMKYCFFICKMDTTRYLPHTIGCWKDQASHLALILSNVSSQSRLGGQVWLSSHEGKMCVGRVIPQNSLNCPSSLKISWYSQAALKAHWPPGCNTFLCSWLNIRGGQPVPRGWICRKLT